jgi:hypothetical protein
MTPPIAPVAVDLLATALEDGGFEARVLDLAWSESVEEDIARELDERPLLVAISCRNVDDSSLASGDYCLAGYAEVARLVKRHTDAPLVAGGSGFSIAPASAMGELGAEFAVWGEGELALVELARSIDRRGPLERVPGLVWTSGGKLRRNPPREYDLASAPAPRRTFVENARYLERGAQVGFETSRGCDRACTYCADPLLKGRRVRARDPESVADEIDTLVRAGVDVLHTCDSEFNAEARHAMAVCERLGARGLGERVTWYAYCSPSPFSPELARAMRSAGCVGVNFGADHTEAAMLSRLGRRHALEDIDLARRACRDAGMAVMFDLLFGAPGETRATVRSCLDAMRALDPDAVGVGLGLRLYRGTPLGDELAPPGGPPAQGVTGASPDLLRPAFYVAPALGKDVAEWLAGEVRGDERCLYFGGAGSAVEGSANYNYNANAELERAIAAGARGAYWDILRRMRGAGDGPLPR